MKNDDFQNILTDSNINLNKQDKEIFKGIILKRILEDIGD